jgi:hypothetical protein
MNMLVKDPKAVPDKWGKRPSDRTVGELLEGGVIALDKPSGPTSHQVTAWAKAATDRAIKGLPGTDGQALTSTATVLVNGTPYVGNMDDAKEFAQFVLTVDSNAYYSTATPAPSTTPAG